MRIALISFFLLIGFFPFSQSLSIEKEKLSAGDESIDLQIIGNSSSYSIVCIARAGEVYTYDGRQLHRWGNQKLKNTEFFNSIYLKDSLLYAELENQFYSFTKDSDFPIKISRKQVKSETPFPWDYPFPSHENSFNISLNKLRWDNETLAISTSIPTYDTEHAITSLWGKPYFLINRKLHSATPSPLSYEKDALLISNQKPIKSFSTPHTLFNLYNNFINIPQFSQSIPLPQDIQSPKNILNILSTSPHRHPKNTSYPNPTILHTKENLFIYHRKKWHTASHSLPQNTAIVTAIPNNDNILFITKKQGVYSYKLTNDITQANRLVPHKLNKKLSEYEYAGAFYLNNTLFFSTVENGIFSFDNNTLKIIKSPVKIKKCIPFENQALLISETGELLKFTKDKKINKCFHHVPMIKPFALLADKNHVYYSKSDSLFTFNVAQKKVTNNIPFQILLNQAYVKKNKIHAFIQDDLYTTYPSYKRNQAPKLTAAFAKTARNKTFRLYPASKKAIELTTDDYPITFLAEASFLENPSSIEYKYSWNDPKVKQRLFSYTNEYSLSTKLIGTAQPTITLKSGNQFNAIKLTPIVTSRVQEQVDYSFILYIALSFIVLLLSIILFSLLRNLRQNKKIQKLEAHQKMMELEQKSLQMQMNPHFIFNSLNGVKGMIALGNTKNAKEYLTKISGWMRNMLNDSRSSQVLLVDEVKNLDLYLDIEQKLRGESFSYKIGNCVNDKSISIPSMMIQPFIENSIIHAFDGSQDNAQIALIFEQIGRKIQVTIEDNGKGMVEKKTSHKSVAMGLIKDRLKLWNENGNLYGVDVINKIKEEHGSSGVRVILRIPIK